MRNVGFALQHIDGLTKRIWIVCPLTSRYWSFSLVESESQDWGVPTRLHSGQRHCIDSIVDPDHQPKLQSNVTVVH